MIKAARLVMSRKGVESTTIAEIAEVADVGFGSFYNYFDSKETIAREVFMEQTKRLSGIARHIMDTIDDPAEVIGLIGRVYVRLGHADPVWGWFVIQIDKSLELMDSILGESGRYYVRKAVKSGQLSVPNPETAIALTLSMFITIVRETLKKQTSLAAADEAIQLVLRMYDVTPKEAARIVALPIPASVLAMLEAENFD